MTGHVIVIAEIGVNHDGSLPKALELVDAAAAAGADVVKFQTFSSSEIAVAHAPLARYQSEASADGSNQSELLAKLALRPEDWEIIAKRCAKNDIEFLSTGFDPDSIAMLLNLGMGRIKIPSGEITNLPLLRYVAELNLPMIVSTGMSTLEEVREAFQVLSNEVGRASNICLLHCTSQYPAHPASVNLRAMQTMQNEFAVSVGYSDHTRGWEVSVAAVAMGASIVEKHLTYSSRATGPDHAASLEPGQFHEMVTAIRTVEDAMGHGRKEPHQDEEEMRLVARRSIVAARPISEGDVIAPDDLTVKRPGNGLTPMLWDSVIGTRATRSYAIDDYIQL